MLPVRHRNGAAGGLSSRRVGALVWLVAHASTTAAEPTAQPSLTFYTHGLCPYAQRIALALRWKHRLGLPPPEGASAESHRLQFETIDIELMDRPPWYEDRLGTRLVPAMEMDGVGSHGSLNLLQARVSHSLPLSLSLSHSLSHSLPLSPTLTHSLPLSPTLSPTLSHSLPLSLSHSLPLSPTLSPTLSHSLTHSLPLSPTLSHSLPLSHPPIVPISQTPFCPHTSHNPQFCAHVTWPFRFAHTHTHKSPDAPIPPSVSRRSRDSPA